MKLLIVLLVCLLGLIKGETTVWRATKHLADIQIKGGAKVGTGYYIIAHDPGNSDQPIVLKTDSSNTLVWALEYDSSVGTNYTFTGIHEYDSGLLVVGHIYVNGTWRPMFMKINYNGGVEYTQLQDSQATGDHMLVYGSVVNTNVTNDELVYCGATGWHNTGDSHFYIAKAAIDVDPFTVSWIQVWEGNTGEVDICHDLAITSQGNYVGVGESVSWSGDSSQAALVVEVTTAGVVTWDYIFEVTVDNQVAVSVEADSYSPGLVAVLIDYEESVVLLRVDQNGAAVSQRLYTHSTGVLTPIGKAFESGNRRHRHHGKFVDGGIAYTYALRTRVGAGDNCQSFSAFGESTDGNYGGSVSFDAPTSSLEIMAAVKMGTTERDVMLFDFETNVFLAPTSCNNYWRPSIANWEQICFGDFDPALSTGLTGGNVTDKAAALGFSNVTTATPANISSVEAAEYVCGQCDPSNCTYCSAQDFCANCTWPTHFVYNADGSCTNDCPSKGGFFNDSSLDPEQCTACADSNCVACPDGGATSCTSCGDGLGWYLHSGVCTNDCPGQGPFWANSAPAIDICVACDDGNCLACSSAGANCTDCGDGLGWYLHSGVCTNDCPGQGGYWANSAPAIDICVACDDENCLTCPSAGATCTDCGDGVGWYLLEGACSNDCPGQGGYWANSAPAIDICVACDDGNCLACPSVGATCTDCGDGVGWFLHLGACTDDCAAQGAFWGDAGPVIDVCAACNDGNCVACGDGGATSCTDCGDGAGWYLYLGTCTNDCAGQGGYWAYASPPIDVCVACDDENCLACPSEGATCTDCGNGAGWYLHSGACTDDCATQGGYWSNSAHLIDACVACDDGNCLACPTAGATCTDCGDGWFLLSGTCTVDNTDVILFFVAIGVGVVVVLVVSAFVVVGVLVVVGVCKKNSETKSANMAEHHEPTPQGPK